MKIKLSKSQWEQIGKSAGWLNKTSAKIPKNIAITLQKEIVNGLKARLNKNQILKKIKANSELYAQISSSGMDDNSLLNYIEKVGMELIWKM